MPLSRRHFTTAALGLVGLAGCSASGTAADAGRTDTGATRTVTTEQGSLTIPADPQRIVVLNFALAGYLFNLGLPVVGLTSEDFDHEPRFAPAWQAEAEAAGTSFIGWGTAGFDLEAVLALEPDLIIGGGIGYPLSLATKAYDQISEIAPTVLVSGELSTWETQFAFLAEDVFDAKDTYDELVQAYQDRLATVRDAITVPDGETAFLCFTGDMTAYGLVETVGLPLLFKDLGFQLAPIFASGTYEVYGGGGDMFEMSTEQVGRDITMPNVFVLGFNADTVDVATLMKNDVYAALPAFESGHAHDLPYWALRGDYDEALATLDEVERIFA